MKTDNRRAKRRPVRYPARIEAGGKDFGECQLSDASESGARLRVSVPADVPDKFTLRLSALGDSVRKCRVVWRSKTEVGIEFDRTKPAKVAK